MKTSNTLRNTALTLMLVFTASFTFSQNEPEPSVNLNREKAEFANAGYWIDAVVVNTSVEKSDRELLANKGYFIEPVVVYAPSEKSDRELLANKGYFIEPVVVQYSYIIPDYLEAQDATVFYTMKSLEDLTISMLDEATER
jgi:hypothetical protein